MSARLPVSPEMTDRTPAFDTIEKKTAALKTVDEAITSLAFFKKLLSDHEPRRSDIFTHLGLLEHTLVELSEVTGYDGMTARENERRYAELRAANARIRELETKIGDQVSADAVSTGIDRYSRIFGAWWAARGFKYADMTPNQWGIRAKVDDELVNGEPHRTFADEKLLKLVVAATTRFTAPEFDVDPGQFHSNLLDTDRNRAAIIAAYAESLPGARVNGFTSVVEDGKFYLRHDVTVPYEDLERWAKSLPSPDGTKN